MFVKFVPISVNPSSGFIPNAKHIISLLIFRYFPKLVALLINLIPRFNTRLYFLRADCDHFGSWLYVFLAYSYLDLKYKNTRLIVCAKKDTIDQQWLNIFNKLPIHVIYNKFWQYLLSPFFHSKFALDVNGHIVFLNGFFPFAEIQSLPPYTDSFISASTRYWKKHFSLIHEREMVPQITRPYILFYARSGSWPHSVKASKRNMPAKLAKCILKTAVSSGFDIVLIGDTSSDYCELSSRIHHINDFRAADVLSIYSGANAVIGSGSGATHFPSFLFDLPTLTFTSKPLYHLDAMYMLPSHSEPYTAEIPLKDKWVMASDLNSIELVDQCPLIVSYFLSNQNLYNKDQKLPTPFSFIYTNIHSPISRTLVKRDRCNILFF